MDRVGRGRRAGSSSGNRYRDGHARAELLSHRGNYYLNEWKEGRREGRKTVGPPFLLVSFLRRPTYNSDILDVTHVSRIFRHCNNPELPFWLVCGCVISSCSVLKYGLGNEKEDVLMGCCTVWKFYCHALERGYLSLPRTLSLGQFRWTAKQRVRASPYLNGHLKFWARREGGRKNWLDEGPLAYLAPLAILSLQPLSISLLSLDGRQKKGNPWELLIFTCF